jgi:hypothetical protein
MNRDAIRPAAALILLSMLPAPCVAEDKKSDGAKCELKRIFLGSFGESSDGREFRLLLEAQLEKHGFSLVNQPDAPEAILEGSARTEQRVTSTGGGHSGGSAPTVSTSTDAFVTVKLSSPDGKKLWHRYFTPNLSLSHLTKPPLERRAIEVADALVKACEKGWPHDEEK